MSKIHKASPFNTSRSMMGTIGPVSRARVCDLVNADPEKPLGAPQRVPCLTYSSVCSVLPALFHVSGRKTICQKT